MHLWDLSGSKIKAKDVEPVEPSSGCLAFSPDGKAIARGISNAVEIINPANGSITKRVDMKGRDISSLAFNTKPNVLAIGSREGSVELWSLDTGKPIRSMDSHADVVSSVAINPAGTRIASTAGNDDFALVSDLRTGKWTNRLRTHFPIDLAFSPDGKTLAIASVTHDVRLWDDKDAKPPYRFLTGHTGWVNSVAFSTTGRLASGGKDGTVRLWEPRSGQQIRKFSGHTDDVNAVAFSPDGKILASASEDGTARLWDAASGKQLHKLIVPLDP
ncbi:WD40 repeat domain-containing protein [Streptomyces sp. NPDC054866]